MISFHVVGNESSLLTQPSCPVPFHPPPWHGTFHLVWLFLSPPVVLLWFPSIQQRLRFSSPLPWFSPPPSPAPLYVALLLYVDSLLLVCRPLFPSCASSLCILLEWVLYTSLYEAPAFLHRLQPSLWSSLFTLPGLVSYSCTGLPAHNRFPLMNPLVSISSSYSLSFACMDPLPCPFLSRVGFSSFLGPFPACIYSITLPAPLKVGLWLHVISFPSFAPLSLWHALLPESSCACGQRWSVGGGAPGSVLLISEGAMFRIFL